MKEAKSEDPKKDFWDTITRFSWKKYTKKCKHCGKNNTYRMKHTDMNVDVPLFLLAVTQGIEHIQKRYVELVEAKNATR